jgi:hypothetical protein
MDHVSVLGALAKLRKATMSFVMSIRLSIRPSFRMDQLGCHWKNVHDIRYLSIFRKSVEKIQVLLKPDKNKGHNTILFYHISFISSYNDKCFRQKL